MLTTDMLVNMLSAFRLQMLTTNNKTASTSADTNSQLADSQLKEKMTQSIYLKLSEQGKAKSREAQKNSDIEESNLPDNLQDLLKRIREIKARIAEKKLELQQTMTNTALSDEERKLKTKQLQSELSSLQGALNDASLNLKKALEDDQLTDEQIATATTLAFK
ncbi:hypothetical protein QE250_12655 [Chromatiaceae bacterium AAb-1]|nr:hypothetical protein [Chromatiaceae bacterium AAb-1]